MVYVFLCGANMPFSINNLFRRLKIANNSVGMPGVVYDNCPGSSFLAAPGKAQPEQTRSYIQA